MLTISPYLQYATLNQCLKSAQDSDATTSIVVVEDGTPFNFITKVADLDPKNETTLVVKSLYHDKKHVFVEMRSYILNAQ